MKAMRVGFIGVGQQGGPMAERMCAAGYPLTVWARRAEAIKTFVASGAASAASVADLGAQCDYVAVCVVDDAGVMDICRQLLVAMRSGAMLVIHSTILPETCEALAEQCAAKGVAFLDAPVSGGSSAAAAGNLTVMCGGKAADFGRAKPVIETFASTIVHLGAAGSGQRAKIVNNAMMAANMGVAHAALSAGRELGIAPQALSELIKQSSGRSFGFEVYARLPEPQAFSHGAPLLEKDVNLLGAILPENPEGEFLRRTAGHFLDAALPCRLQNETELTR